MLHLQDLFETIGLERDRVRMIFISAAEGERFRQLTVEFDAIIRKLGPSKLRHIQQELLLKAAQKKTVKAE